jgi:hypothetical protein
MPYDFPHRTENRAAWRNAGFKQINDVLLIPVSETGLGIRSQRRCISAKSGDQAASQICALFCRTEGIAVRMASGTVAQSLHEIRAAIPFCCLACVRLIDLGANLMKSVAMEVPRAGLVRF